MRNHSNDAVAVQMLVQAWSQLVNDGGTPVRYYKKKGEVNADTSEVKKSLFTKEDFMLVMQSAAQSEMLRENPRILCVDATHGITGYSFYLLSIVVIDRYGKGLVIGWAITSRENLRTWEILAKSLRESSLSAQPEVLMSDDDNSAWNGVSLIWKSLKHKLLCHWHIKQNIHKHCFGTKAKVQVM